MVRKIRLTKNADKRFDEILEYLNKEFGKPTATKFIERTYSFFDLIAEHPQIGRIEDKRKGNLWLRPGKTSFRFLLKFRESVAECCS
jgi:plasmid stabilization system protein ParE